MGDDLLSAITRYLAVRCGRGEYRPSTRRRAYHTLTLWARQVGNPPVEQLARHHLERWQAGLTVSPRTRRNYLVTVRTFLRWAGRHDLAATLTPGRVPRTLPRQLTVVDTAALYRSCRDERELLILTLMLQLGLRCCEVAGLAWEDIDPHSRVVLVTGKGGHQRVLPLTAATWRAVETYHLAVRVTRVGPLVRQLRDPHLGLRAGTVSILMSDLFARAGVRRVAHDGKSAHAARHTAAGDVLRAGAHLRDVQAMLGHQSLATTQIYLPLLVGDLRAAMEGRDYDSPDAA